MAPKQRKSLAATKAYQPPRALSSTPNTVPVSRTRRQPRVNYAEAPNLDEDISEAELSRKSDTESSDSEFDHEPSDQYSDHEGDMDVSSNGQDSDSEVEQPDAKRQRLTKSTPKTASKSAPTSAPKTTKSAPSSTPDSATTTDVVVDAAKPSKKDSLMAKLFEGTGAFKQINLEIPPISTIEEIFVDITEKAITEDTQPSLLDAIKHLRGRPLRVATMCSGSESPLLALEMVRDSLKELGCPELQVEHMFSAEIEPFKQAYIERNFHPPIIFRDIVEIVKGKDTKGEMATTAYGALVKIPKDVDIIVAGTSCVDFSRLNTKPKTLEEKGESGDTFDAVLAYAQSYRPAILILENVDGAPWNEMLKRYEEIGYEAAGVKVDTKNYYLPQTRQRGYMVCFNKEKIPKDLEAGQLSDGWQNIMRTMRRQVSAPISDFLLPDDDTRIVRSRQRSARQILLDTNLREVDWAKCELGHTKYRRSNGLGNNRPLTEWQESGTIVLPEHFDKAWYRRQPERVWDFVEMSFLRKAKGKMLRGHNQDRFDIQFKTRVWDVSQNIYRFTDCAPFGVANCLTPSGIFYLSDRGGPLMDVESLVVQGLPLDRITFTTESSRQIQDLAGNAMSSPVVGSAIVAALMVGHRVLKVDDENVLEHKNAEGVPTIKGISKFDKYRQIDQTNSDDLDIPSFLEEAQRSSRKCNCEGQISVTAKPIQTCLDCHHTSCVTCGVKPSHEYDDPKHLDRDNPQDFIQKWRRHIPMHIRFQDTEDLEAFLSPKIHEEKPQNARNESQPKSQNAKKQRKSRKSSKNTPLDSQSLEKNPPLKEGYLEAVANAINCSFTFKELRRMSHWIVTYESPHAKLELVLDGEMSEWRLFLKPDRKLTGDSKLRSFLKQPVAKSTINNGNFFGEHWSWRVPETVQADFTITNDGDDLPSWAARLGLVQYADEVIPSRVHIQSAADCKFQEDVSGLYEHLPNCGTACDSMYKRADSSGSRDMFFFLDPGKITNPNVDSFVFAFDSSKLQYGQTREVICSIDAKWRPWNQIDGQLVSAKSDGNWINEESCRLVDTQNKPTFAIYGEPLVHHDCKVFRAIASCKFEVPEKTEARFTGIRQVQPEDKAFFEAFNWALEPLRRDLGHNDKHVLNHDALVKCQDCAPPLPEVRWNLARRSQKVKKAVFRPYEDVQTATTYEIALKKRPQPFILQSRIEDGKAQLDIGVNILSLCQRAVGKLSRFTNEFDSVSWSLDTTFSKDGAICAPKFSLRDNNQDVAYTRDIFGLRLKLFDEQKRSLGWMRNQEAGDGKDFALKEIEEAVLPHLGWRLETEAIGIEHVRGGILADHAGFGKTVTSLGLIHSEFVDRRSAANIKANMKELGRSDASQVMPRKLAATLVICPKNLVLQWKNEAIKFPGQAYQDLTITIEDLKDLKRCSVSQFEKARIIVVNQAVLENEQYRQRLAVFGGVPECVSKGSREVKSWFEMATRDIPAHLEILQRDGLKALKARLKSLYIKHLDDENLRAFAQQSKRYKGDAYAKKKSSKPLIEVTKVTTKSLLEDRATLGDDELEKCVLFEMFHFNRIIVDEFSYLSSGDLYSFGAIKADKRWGLSATPQLKDPYDVSRMANLLGLRLPVGASAHGLMSDKNMRALRVGMTDLEEFETFRDSPSRIIQGKVHSLAQDFLDAFVRQNVLDTKKWKYDDLLVPVVPNADQRISYTDASQKLNSQDMRIRKGKKDSANQNTANSAEEVLLKEAALFIPDDEQRADATKSSLAAVLDTRSKARDDAKTTLQEQIDDCRRLAENLKLAACPFQSWAGSIENDSLGDTEVSQEVREMIGELSNKRSLEDHAENETEDFSELVGDLSDEAEEDEEDELVDDSSDEAEEGEGGLLTDSPSEHPEEGDKVEKEKKEPKTKAGLETKISKVNQMAKAFVTSIRSVKFVEKANAFDKYRSGEEKETPGCECCEESKSPEHLSVSAACGHVICTSCFEASKRSFGKCDATGCSKDVRSYHLLGFDKIGDVTSSKYGKKADTVVDLLKYIRGEKQKAILFVQFDDQVKKIEAMLTEEQIVYETAKDQASIARFTTAPAVTVMLLNSSDVSAAGMNLMVANHVIFFSPVLKESQYEYDAQMAQGIGRVRRHGQTNSIYVYRMASLSTIDVDILEQRERRTDMLVEFDLSNTNPMQVHRGGTNKLNSKPVRPLTENERTQMIRDPGDSLIKLVPKSLLIDGGNGKVEGKFRIKGYEDFSALVKFSRAFADTDD